MKIFLIYLGLICFSLRGYAQSSTLTEISQEIVVPANVLKVIDQYFGNKVGGNIKITPLLGGHSSANFYIELESNQYVLRFNEKASSLRFQCELFAMEESAKAGISPIVFQSFPEDKMVLIEYILVSLQSENLTSRQLYSI